MFLVNTKIITLINTISIMFLVWSFQIHFGANFFLVMIYTPNLMNHESKTKIAI